MTVPEDEIPSTFLTEQQIQALLQKAAGYPSQPYSVISRGTVERGSPWASDEHLPLITAAHDKHYWPVERRLFPLETEEQRVKVVQDWYQNGKAKLTDPYIMGKSAQPAGQTALENLFRQNLGDRVKAVYRFYNGFKYSAQEIQGPYVRWYENGQKELEAFFINGVQEGSWTRWDEEGRVLEKGQYEGGVKVGRWYYWYDNGRLAMDGEYDREKGKTGKWRIWWPTGSLAAQGEYFCNKKQGIWVEFSQVLRNEEAVLQGGAVSPAAAISLYSNYQTLPAVKLAGRYDENEKAIEWEWHTPEGKTVIFKDFGENLRQNISVHAVILGENAYLGCQVES